MFSLMNNIVDRRCSTRENRLRDITVFSNYTSFGQKRVHYLSNVRFNLLPTSVESKHVNGVNNYKGCLNNAFIKSIRTIIKNKNVFINITIS